MGGIQGIKDFINIKILKKNKVKLLGSGVNSEYIFNIDYKQIKEHLKLEKYKKDLEVSFFKIDKKFQKKLLKKMINDFGGKSNLNYDCSPLISGSISNDLFILLQKKNIDYNRIGQLIYTENGYTTLSARKDKLPKELTEIEYKSVSVDKDKYKSEEYDEKKNLYKMCLKIGDTCFKQSASFATEEQIEYIESHAQPFQDGIDGQRYSEVTGIPVITGVSHNLKSVLKANPYIVNIQLSKTGKNLYSQSITKVFRSKKECVVGYKPKIIIIEEYDGVNKTIKSYRETPEGEYVDNQSFVVDLVGKYNFDLILLDDIKSNVDAIPFDLSNESKLILKSGIEIPNHIKILFNKGAEQIKLMEIATN